MKSVFSSYFSLCRSLIKISPMKRNLDTPDCRSRKLKPVQSMANSSSGDSTQPMPTSVDAPDTDDIQILETPIKSENDKKEYRAIRLKNGLTALLISDLYNGVANEHEESMTDTEEDAMSVDETDSVDGEGAETDGESSVSSQKEKHSSVKPTANATLSSASLTIKVGSFQDPDEIPGLAHFLEHMVFMGSEKYPEENDFDSFIKKQGGHDNAATDWDVTTFYFVSQERHLKIALDKFAQFFISPLMKKDAMQREREAIESEFKLALPSDYYRKKQLLGSFAKDKHPARKFPWGNIASLGGGNSKEEQEKRDTEIHAKLHEFRKCYYVGESITLAIQSRHELDALQQMVVECLSNIPAKPEIVIQHPKYSEKPFETPEFCKFYKVLPVKDICQVDLTWALPSMLHKYKKKPDKYISWLLGHEGKGSLVQYLREKVWALQLYSGSDESGADHNSHYMQFGLTLVLTDEGLEHLTEVIKSVFSYLKLLRNKGPQKRIFDEMQKVMETRFRFAPEPTAGDNVETLSENMQKYPPIDYIRGSELYFEYDEQEITQCLELFTPQNVNIILFNKNSNEKYDHTEEWFGTQYSVEDINPVELQSWIDAKPLPCFHLPEPNPYIATDFTILAPEMSTKETFPEQVSCDEKGELWFKQDAKFMLPRAYLYFQLISPLVALSPTNSVLLDLMISLLKQQLHAEVYPAEIAELSFSLYPSIEGVGHGLGIEVSGFNQKSPLLLEAILKQMMRFDVDLNESLFLAVKDKQKKQYYNSFLKPSKLIKNVTQSLLKTCYWSSLDCYAAIDDVTVSKLAEFAREFRGRLYIRALLQGNLSREQAIQIMNMVNDTLQYKAILPNTWPQLRIGQAEIGSRVCRVASFNKESSNSVVSHIFECGLANIKDCCISEIIMTVLEETVFDKLRTKEQLGYDVSCRDSITRGVLNFVITVNSQVDKHSLDHVDSRIWAVLEGFASELSQIPDTELQELKLSAMRHKLKADLQLQEEVERNWTEVTTEEYFFNRRHIEHDTLSMITLEDMASWLQKHVFDPTGKRHLSIQVQGYSQVEKGLQQILKVEGEEDEVKKPSEDKPDGKHACVTNPLQILVPEDKTSNPITDIEEYKRSIYFYPMHKVLQ